MAAAPGTAQPQFMTGTGGNNRPTEPLIENIEYDQIVVPDVRIFFLQNFFSRWTGNFKTITNFLRHVVLDNIIID